MDNDNGDFAAYLGRKKKLASEGKNAYYDFVAGEEEIVDGEVPFGEEVQKLIRKARKTALLHAGLFQIKPINTASFVPAASNVLFCISQDMEVNLFHLADILERGADPNFVDEPSFAQTPIFGFIRSANIPALKLMISAGANVNVLDNRARNPLMMACDTKLGGAHLEVVKLLLRQPGVIERIERRDSGGNSALLNAIFNNNVWIVRELLMAGAQVMTKGVTSSSLNQSGSFASSTAYEVALWIYAVSLGLHPEDLPEEGIRPTGWKYEWFSPKGRYDDPFLLGLQTCWKYSAEMVFRMIHRKGMEEQRINGAGQVELRNERDRIFDWIQYPQAEQHKCDHSLRLQNRNKKRILLSHRKQQKEIDRWNEQRKMMAEQIDAEYSKKLRKDGNVEGDLLQWNKEKFIENGVSLPLKSRAASRTKQKLTAARSTDAISSVATWVSAAKPSKSIYRKIPVADPKTAVPQLTLETMLGEELATPGEFDYLESLPDGNEDKILNRLGLSLTAEEIKEEKKLRHLQR